MEVMMTFNDCDFLILYLAVYLSIGVLFCLAYNIYILICCIRIGKPLGHVFFIQLLCGWFMTMLAIAICYPFAFGRIKEWYRETERLVHEAKKSS